MIKADLHMHTLHSHGCSTTLEMFTSCKERNLSIIGFSEHSPRPKGYTYPIDYQPKLAFSFPRYIKEVSQLKEEEHDVEVLLGVEIDFITEEKAYAEKLCQEYPYDYCIGGLHFQGKWGFDASKEDWEKLRKEEIFGIYSQYYKDIKAMCDTGLFNFVSHPDLIKIFTVDIFHEWLTTQESRPVITEALEAIVNNSMTMEISSAGLRKPCNEIYPGPVIMQMAKEIHVPITFSSDAHCANTPAYAFDTLEQYAASYGYKESFIFRNKKPVAIPFSHI